MNTDETQILKPKTGSLKTRISKLKTDGNNKPVKLHNRKPVRGLNPQMDKFKATWCEMPDEVRERWRKILVSVKTRAEIRGQIRRELNVDLNYDKQVTRFRQWAEKQEGRFFQGRYSESRKRNMLASGMTLAEAQEKLLQEATDYSLAARDFSLALKTSSEITKVQNTALNRDKFESTRTVTTPKAKPAAQKLSDTEKVSAAHKRLFGAEVIS
jgi:hypothetical protein